MRRRITPESLNKLVYELDELDNFVINIRGKKLKASQCYRFVADPPHILFNTNCPVGLAQKIQSIIEKYIAEEDEIV